MNRRKFINNLKQFCYLYGVSGVLSNSVLAQSQSKKRLVSFIIRYVGGTTTNSGNGVGYWDFNNTLAPLKSFENDTARIMGMSGRYKGGGNAHIGTLGSSLAGAGSTFKLLKFSTGNGKSIDTLIGEKLQREEDLALPLLSMSNMDNTNAYQSRCSWGEGGILLPSLSSVEALKSEVKNQIACIESDQAKVAKQLKALSFIKNNNKLFESRYLIDKAKFQKLEDYTEELSQKLNPVGSDLKKCDELDSIFSVNSRYTNANIDEISKKLDEMYDIAIVALKHKVTNVLTFNLYHPKQHGFSHYGGNDDYKKAYLQITQDFQSSIAVFMNKMKEQGLYDDTLFYCNAGMCMDTNLHNFNNISSYVVNSGKSGLVGDVKNPIPPANLLVDMLHKYGLNYTSYGGTNHEFGVGKKGNLI